MKTKEHTSTSTKDILLEMVQRAVPGSPQQARAQELLDRELRRLDALSRAGKASGPRKARTRKQAQAAVNARWEKEMLAKVTSAHKRKKH